jgi:hypothetical protein
MSETDGHLAEAKVIGRPATSTVRRVLAIVPGIGAAVAITLLWRAGLGLPRSPGWGIAGMVMVALMLLAAALATAAILRRGRGRGPWIAVAVALAIAPSVAWLRDRVHDDAAWAAVRAADRPKLLEQYLAWGRRHRDEAIAMRDRHASVVADAAAAERAARVAAARTKLASTVDPSVRDFFDAAFTADGALQVAVTVTAGTADAEPAVIEALHDAKIATEVAVALRTVWAAGTVSVDLVSPHPTSVDVTYHVRPWIEDTVPVVYGAGAFIDMGITPSRVFPAIELVLDLRLRRPGAPDAALSTVVHPPRELQIRSLMPLFDAYGDAAVSRQMVAEAVTRISNAIEKTIAPDPARDLARDLLDQ